ncbi:MAG: restriction endonuclease [Xanthomonadales bacterium]|nr:restriction endonuclease [Xanthomonadales bacterium]ODU93002.1 MAG: hypothetical protein ABT18_09475 [Rhodanobacter sp. SCN 66-43]OJY83830.1 MAG: hypothetical protein BGP23_14540 [Xanthomonadales bacterium 66-474]
MTKDALQNSVRYVKNGRNGQWWKAAKENSQIHLGWKTIPRELLQAPDLIAIERIIKNYYGTKRGATQDVNALHDALDAPSRHIWTTFQDGYMWWCTAKDGAIPNPRGESADEGNFWLNCDRPWSNRSLNGTLLAMPDLPGSVTKTAGFRGTICTPRAWQSVLRIIRGETDPDAANAGKARANYESAVLQMIKRLSWKDFEQLIDLILTRSGWVRISTVGKTREGVDIDAENVAVGEIAFVQVKSAADQGVLANYIERFEQRRDYYARMIFAVHSPTGMLTPPPDTPVQIWSGDLLARLAVRTGLGEWVETRLA